MVHLRENEIHSSIIRGAPDPLMKNPFLQIMGVFGRGYRYGEKSFIVFKETPKLIVFFGHFCRKVFAGVVELVLGLRTVRIRIRPSKYSKILLQYGPYQ
jgi:hypothetical protein